MLNCGFTQIDISDLHPSEVDWEVGRIIRKRSKTNHHKNVPTVSYKLWDMTWKLLQEHGSRSGDRVLTTRQGKPWVEDGLKANGKRTKRDGINSNYRHLNTRHWTGVRSRGLLPNRTRTLRHSTPWFKGVGAKMKTRSSIA